MKKRTKRLLSGRSLGQHAAQRGLGLLASVLREKSVLFSLFAALALLTALRLLVAGLVPLSPDETYYAIWARVLQPGYLDHPPMVALWIRAGEWLVGPSPLGVRFFGPFAVAIGSVLLWDGGRVLAGPRAGLVAAALLNATLFVGVGAVVMTPDTPLLLFWIAALWAALRGMAGRPGWWLVVGLAAGLALDSKYTALLLGLALAIWLLAWRRDLLARWQVWAGLALSMACFAPVVWWNVLHGLASFAKQGGRNEAFAPSRALQFEAELLGGQVGLVTPWVFGLCVLGVWRSWRRLPRDAAAGLLCCSVLVPGLVFLLHATGDRVQANWPAILWPGACLAAGWLAARFWLPAAALGFGMAMLVYAQAAGLGMALPVGVDPTLARLGGWDGLALHVSAARRAQGATFVVSDEYGLASELAWHLPGTVVGVEPRWALFRLPPAAMQGPGLLVQSEHHRELPDRARFGAVILLGVVVRERGGMVAERYRLYRVGSAPLGEAGDGSVLLPTRRDR